MKSARNSRTEQFILPSNSEGPGGAYPTSPTTNGTAWPASVATVSNDMQRTTGTAAGSQRLQGPTQPNQVPASIAASQALESMESRPGGTTRDTAVMSSVSGRA
ncbi:hypothetical protein CF326_g7773 [Tilletia indica]|nr:hypothetical protein CF326_g7773 [Tilletia indica]